jgi:hypothetical protein
VFLCDVFSISIESTVHHSHTPRDDGNDGRGSMTSLHLPSLHVIEDFFLPLSEGGRAGRGGLSNPFLITVKSTGNLANAA